MKLCGHCGKENEDPAIVCAECGAREFKGIVASPDVQTVFPPRDSKLWLREIVADPVRLFRALVILANAAYVISAFAPFFEPAFMAPEVEDLLNQHGHGAIFTMPGSVFWLSTLLYLAIAVGLYQFSASARAAFAVLTVGFGVLLLFSGVAISSPLVGFLTSITAMADGAILLLAYATPLRERFG